MERVLIVDNSPAFANTLAQRFQEMGHVFVRQEESVESLLQSIRPTALVLDLAAPGIDGLSVVQHILQCDDPPVVLVTSVLTSNYVIDSLQRMHISYTMRRPCTTAMVVNRVKDMLLYKQRKDAQKEVYKKYVFDILSQLKIPMHMKGAKYAQAALELYLMDQGMYFNGEIYPRIAARYGTDVKCVERCIRNAVDNAWATCDQQVWGRYFEADAQGRIRRPSNTVFISRIGQYILAQVQKEQ